MGDLDSFESLTDRFGRAAGDLALAACRAGDPRARLRRRDAVGRLGRDEYAVVLPNADRAAADGW
jgi:diguanylate cyclase (GGDEF)-like protein